MNDFIVTTTNSLEGYKIEKYLGLYSDRIVVGSGMYSEFFAGFTDIFGGRSSKFEARLNELYEIAIDKLTKTAKSKGANALVGVKLDVDEISGKNLQMFMLNIAGTAVFVNRIQRSLNDEIVDNNDEQITGYTIKQKVVTDRLVRELANITSYYDVQNIFKKSNDENIVLPIEIVLKTANSLSNDILDDEYVTLYSDYLDSYDKDTLNNVFNVAIASSTSFSDIFFCVI